MKHHLFSSIAVLSAMNSEHEPFLKRIGAPCRGIKSGRVVEQWYKGKRIVCSVIGVGKKSVVKRLRQLDAVLGSVDAVIVMGICGALDETLHIGDIIIPCSVMTEDGSMLSLPRDINIDSLLQQHGENVLSDNAMMTCDRLIQTKEKKILHNRFPHAQAIDMESFYVAEALRAKNTPLLIIKAISDTVYTSLPQESFLIAQRAQVNRFKRIMHALRHPYAAYLFMRLHYTMSKAIMHNVAFVSRLLDVLP